MEMDVFPTILRFLPNSRFLKCQRFSLPLIILSLNQPNVADDRTFVHDSHVRIGDGRLCEGLLVTRKFEIVLVKRQAMHQVAQGLWLKTGHTGIAQATVGFPIARRDTVEQLLRSFHEFFFSGQSDPFSFWGVLRKFVAADLVRPLLVRAADNSTGQVGWPANSTI